MSIVLLTMPNSTPSSGLENYERQNAYITATLQAFTGRVIVDGTTIHGGTKIKIADVLYVASSDTAITGTQSNYVKITPSGTSATASFVDTLTGVSWSHSNGQYLDGSGNLYLFDEAQAIADGEISTPYTLTGQLKAIYSDLLVNGDLSAVGVTLTGGVSAVSDVTLSAGSFVGKSSSETVNGPGNVSTMIKDETRTVTHTTASDYSISTPSSPSDALYLTRLVSGSAVPAGTILTADQVIESTDQGTTVFRITRIL